MSKFNESDHPRGEDGKFTSGGGLMDGKGETEGGSASGKMERQSTESKLDAERKAQANEIVEKLRGIEDGSIEYIRAMDEINDKYGVDAINVAMRKRDMENVGKAPMDISTEIEKVSTGKFTSAQNDALEQSKARMKDHADFVSATPKTISTGNGNYRQIMQVQYKNKKTGQTQLVAIEPDGQVRKL